MIERDSARSYIAKNLASHFRKTALHLGFSYYYIVFIQLSYFVVGYGCEVYRIKIINSIRRGRREIKAALLR